MASQESSPTADPASEHQHDEETDSWIVWNDEGEVKTGLTKSQAAGYVAQHQDDDPAMYAECTECAETIE